MAFVDAALLVGTSVGADALGATAATVIGGGLIGAGVGGLYGGLTGGNIGQDMLYGGLLGGGGAYLGGAGAAAEATPEIAETGTALPTATPAVSPEFLPVSTPMEGVPVNSPYTPTAQELDANAWGSEVGTNPANAAAPQNFVPGSAATPGASPMSGLSQYMPTAKQAAMGLTVAALAKGLGQQNTITPQQTANPITSGLDYKYDRNTYQPSVAPNYNGIAGLATGPRAQSLSGYGYADGGSIGTVEEMSRENATGGNPMFPQAGLGGLTGENTYQNATNTPTSSNLMEPTDAITDPYTGAMRFAAGGPAPTAQNMLNTMSQSTANAMQNGNSGGFDPIGSASNLISGNTSGSGSQGIDFANDPNYVFDQRTGQYVRRFKTGGKTPRTPTANAQQNTNFNLPEVKKHMAATRTPEGLKAVSTAAQGGDYNAQFALNQMQGSPVQGIDAASQMPATIQAAQGGIMGGTIGSYSDGGQMLKGPGDGMSDSIPAKIGKHQPARLADSEFVIPADVVSHLGNGSSDAGAKQLYAMMDRIRKARTGTKKQGKQIKPEKYMPA